MNRKQISATLTVRTVLTRKGFTATAYFRGQEVGSAFDSRKQEWAKEDARKVGTEAVYAALGLAAIESEILGYLNGPWLKAEAAAGHTYLSINEGNQQKMERLLARCQELAAQRTTESFIDNAGSKKAAGQSFSSQLAVA